MQKAVLEGKIKDINKIGKFSRAAALKWPFPVILNPIPDMLDQQALTFVAVDPQTAEASDE